jgi:hypothetical protein
MFIVSQNNLDQGTVKYLNQEHKEVINSVAPLTSL